LHLESGAFWPFSAAWGAILKRLRQPATHWEVMADVIPFTDDGMMEATSSRVTAETLDAAWRRVVNEMPSLSEADRALALSGKIVITAPGAYCAGFNITDERRVVAIQGGWWYRGVTSVEPHPNGTLVTYTVVNVAPGWTKWLAHFFQAREHRKRIARLRA
jgi:hypothetical protein